MSHRAFSLLLPVNGCKGTAIYLNGEYLLCVISYTIIVVFTLKCRIFCRVLNIKYYICSIIIQMK